MKISRAIDYSPIESARFGKNVFRGNFDEKINQQVIDELKERLYDKKIDILILRIPVSEQHQLYLFNQLNFEIIFADTLVYYQLKLENIENKTLKNQDLTFIKATIEDKKEIEDLVTHIFQYYQNHYTSNPLINQQKLIEGYQEWALSFIGTQEEKSCFLVKKSGATVAFFTVSHYHRIGEIVLGGTLESYKGLGIYQDSIRHFIQFFKGKQCEKILLSTQIHNFITQRVWIKEGFIIEKAYITLHINSLLTDTKK